MKRWSQWVVAALVCAFGAVGSPHAEAKAVAIIRLNPVQGLTQSDVVVIGKVKEIEKAPIEAAQHAGQDAPKMNYTIAVIDIKDSIKGADALTQIRVGFPEGAIQPQAAPFPGKGEIQRADIIRPYRGQISQALALGQEGCFFLQKHPTANFYLQVPYCTVLDAKAANFKEELAQVTDAIALFKDPVKALKVEDKKKRYASLQTLLQYYGTHPQNHVKVTPAKRVEVPAEVSKVIMNMIAEMPEVTPDPDTGMNIQSLFYFLQATTTDGWTQPKFVQGQDFQKLFGEAAKKWVKDHADTFRLKRYESN